MRNLFVSLVVLLAAAVAHAGESSCPRGVGDDDRGPDRGDINGPATTATSLASGTDPSTFGGSVTFAGSVSPASATGTVTVFDGARSVGACTLASGRCTVSTSELSIGTHRMTASYSGTAGCSASESAPLSQVVAPGSVALAGLWLDGPAGGTSLTIPAIHQVVVTYTPSDATDRSLTWSVCTSTPTCSSIGAGWTCSCTTPTASSSGFGSVSSTGLFTPPSSIATSPTILYVMACNAASALCDWTPITVSDARGGSSTPAAPPPGGNPAAGGPPTIPTGPVSGGGGSAGVGSGTTSYVAHASQGGSDSNPGTQTQPWRTLGNSIPKLNPGDTLYIRGSATVPDTNTGCTSDGAQGGACWTETDATSMGTGSPLHWDNVGNHQGGTSSGHIRIAAYPGEVVIVEPSSGSQAVVFDARNGPSACSYIDLEGLIIDARNVGAAAIRADPQTVSADPTTDCGHITVTGGKIRHGKGTSGVQWAGYASTFSGVEVYENGNSALGTGDHDHGYYILGTHNTITGGRVHHNLQGIQVWNEDRNGLGYTGYNQILGVEVDHNGTNPWNGAVRYGNDGQIGIYHDVGSHAVVDGCKVHENTGGDGSTVGSAIGISVGTNSWTTIPALGVTVSNSYVWGNAIDDIVVQADALATTTVVNNHIGVAP